jgi:hypothetical protein
MMTLEETKAHGRRSSRWGSSPSRRRVISSSSRTAGRRPRRRAIESHLCERLTDWRGFLRGQVSAARQIPRKLIPERLVFTPHTEGEARYYTFGAHE